MTKKMTYKQYKEAVEAQGQAILDALAFAATGSLDVEIDIGQEIDVMTDLAVGFSYLIDDIKELLLQQKRYQEALEARVAERTAELEQALAEVQATQKRYLREQWEAYVPDTVTETTAVPVDDVWLPVLTGAVQAQKAVYETPQGNGAVLALPVSYADQVIGVLGFGADDSVHWEEEDITAVEAVVEQLGLALENQRLFDQAQQRAHELAILNEMVGELTLLPDEESLLEAVYRYISRLMDTSNFYIAIHVPEREEIYFPIATEHNQRVNWRPRSFGNGMTEFIIQTGEGLFLEDGLEAWLEANGIDSIGMVARTWMGVPLRLGAEVTGVIAMQSQQSFYYTAAQFDLLGAVANQAIIAIQNARQFQQEQARAQREQRLREVAAKIRGSADVDTIMRMAVQEIGQALGRQTFVYLGLGQNDTPQEDA